MSFAPSAPVSVPLKWRPTTSAIPRLTAGLLLVVTGLLAGRWDVAVLGVPLALSVVWGLTRPPGGMTDARLEQAHHLPADSRIDAGLVLTPGDGVATTQLRIGAPGHRNREVIIDARERRTLRLSLTTARTGYQEVFRADHEDRDARTVLRAGPITTGPGTLVVLPNPAALGELPLPYRLQGLTGAHRSPRPGEGGDLRDIALFASGDRLRRIDWKATARRAGSSGLPGAGITDLYVRRTFATADAHVMLVLDARDTVGPDLTTWGVGGVHPDDLTSLDIARRAATSIAKSFLDRGDRVGLVELGRHRRPLRPAAGRRHLRQIAHQLATSRPRGEPGPQLRAPQVPAGCLVVVLSTFLDEEAARLARGWRFAGHRTVAVDVLPTVVTDTLTPRMHTAHRIVAMERADRIATLTAAGVEVVAWEDDPARGGRVEVVLAALSRTRRAGR